MASSRPHCWSLAMSSCSCFWKYSSSWIRRRSSRNSFSATGRRPFRCLPFHVCRTRPWPLPKKQASAERVRP